MKTAYRYLEHWIRDKPAGLANYLNFNKHRKKEICYIFKLRSESDGCNATLHKRHLNSS